MRPRWPGRSSIWFRPNVVTPSSRRNPTKRSWFAGSSRANARPSSIGLRTLQRKFRGGRTFASHERVQGWRHPPLPDTSRGPVVRGGARAGPGELMRNSRVVGRIVALAAVVIGVVALVVVLSNSGSDYTIHARFQNASQIVKGNL